MRHIERLAEPDILAKKKTEWTNNFIASGKDRPDSTKYAHKDIVTTLFTMSHNKCFYCETLVESNREIDHFIEVSENKEFAFDWNNLMLSCKNCNNKISNRNIPVVEVLNPCKDTDEEINKHLSYENETITFLTEKGEKTVKKFKLLSPDLEFLRLKKLVEFMRFMDIIKDKMISENRQTMNENEIKDLQRFARPDYCFSKMFSTILEKHGIE